MSQTDKFYKLLNNNEQNSQYSLIITKETYDIIFRYLSIGEVTETIEKKTQRDWKNKVKKNQCKKKYKKFF